MQQDGSASSMGVFDVFPFQNEESLTSVWQAAALIVILSWIAVLALFLDTAAALFKGWEESYTSSYGVLIVPVSIYLIWHQRSKLMALVPKPSLWAWGALGLFGFTWVLGSLANTLVIQQLALVAMLNGVVWAVIGTAAIRVILFPLGFLFCAVPLGEEFIAPFLQDFTSVFAVTTLKLSGVPVLSEGRLISVPGGDWYVEEACSGFRYLVASLVLGVLFSAMVYRTWYRRLIFLAISAIVPILANGVRAYLVVMLSQYTSIDIVDGAHHFFFGWIFYGIMIGVMGWVGLRWEERDAIGTRRLSRTGQAPSSATYMPSSREPVWWWRPGARMSYAAAGSLVIVMLAPYAAQVLSSVPHRTMEVMVPQASGSWKLVESSVGSWVSVPTVGGVEVKQSYAGSAGPVHLSITYFSHQRQGAEVINAGNRVYEEPDVLVSEAKTDAMVEGQWLEVDQAIVQSDGRSRLIWRWYWVNGVSTSNPYVVKLLESKAQLMGKSQLEAMIMLWTDSDQPERKRSADLQEFLRHVSLFIRS